MNAATFKMACQDFDSDASVQRITRRSAIQDIQTDRRVT